MVRSAEKNWCPWICRPVAILLPAGDGSWFQVCDGNCQTSPGLFPPAIFSHSTREGHRIYIAEAELNGQTIDLYLELNPTTAQVLNTWAVPHIKSRKGTLIPSRLELNPEPGDSLQFAGYALQRDGSLQRSLGPKLQFRSQPVPLALYSFARQCGTGRLFCAGQQWQRPAIQLQCAHTGCRQQSTFAECASGPCHSNCPSHKN